MPGEVRYCTTDDGVRIAYTDDGAGPIVVGCPHTFESFALDHLFPAFQDLRRRLYQGNRVIRYDMRGTGLSQRHVEDVSHAAFMRDLEAVVEATSVSNFTLIGSSLGGARAIEYAARHPDRVRRLVLWGSVIRLREAYPEAAFRSFLEFMRTSWPIASQTMIDMDPKQRSSLPQDEILGFGKLLRASVSGEMAARIISAQYETEEVTGLLPRVRAPTLVIDRQADSRLAQEIAASIPDARLVLIPGDSSFLIENARPAIDAIREFLGSPVSLDVRSSQPEASPAFRTVLFTDLVGHTGMMARLGDERGRAVLREHERITREVLKRHDGAEVKTTGDGFMASFASVTRAMDCAIALQRAFAAHDGEPLQVRVGLNAGEPIAEDNDLFGATVILASRIAEQAGAGEILIPEPLRHLLSGKRYVYSDHGEVALKGFEDTVRLYEVRWRVETH